MKKSKLVLLALVGVSIFFACKKDETPDPTNNTNNNTQNQEEQNNKNTSDLPTLCGGTSCSTPVRIMPQFMPSGYYDSGEQTVTLHQDSCDMTPAYEGECLRIVYTYHNNYWGAHYQDPTNNDAWNAKYQMGATVSTLKFECKLHNSANVTFNAFADAKYGKYEFYQYENHPLDTWIAKTINLTSVPDTFNSPLNIVIDFDQDKKPNEGDKIVVDVKDIRFE